MFIFLTSETKADAYVYESIIMFVRMLPLYAEKLFIHINLLKYYTYIAGSSARHMQVE